MDLWGGPQGASQSGNEKAKTTPSANNRAKKNRSAVVMHTTRLPARDPVFSKLYSKITVKVIRPKSERNRTGHRMLTVRVPSTP